MKNYPYYHVDAFTKVKFGGNQCAILFDTDDIDDNTMQKIASEMNLPETVFVQTSLNADFKFRFFTPLEELPLAGHPTIATVHALIEDKRIKLPKSGIYKITLELKAGVISVEVDTDSLEIKMNQLAPLFLKIYEPDEILSLFNLSFEDLLPNCKIQTVSTGTPQLMVPLKNIESVKKAKLNIDKYIEYKKTADFSSPHIFCLKGATVEGDTFARHLLHDVPEDPFTGSGTGNMAAYLWRYQLIKEPIFIAEQGYFIGRPGKANVKVFGNPDNITGVQIGGTAVTCIKGEFFL